jgi:histidine triad (HIT) family protein
MAEYKGIGTYQPHQPKQRRDPNCIFCRIVDSKIPSFHVYKDENFEAFLDITPLNPGHTIVVPKDHYRWVWDVPEAGKMFEVARKIAKAMQKSLGTEWIVAVVIGEAVEHAHIQLIPRFADDGHGGAINFSARKELSKEQMEQAAEMLRKALQE